MPRSRNSRSTPESQAAATLFGIPNCDQVRRARQWIDAHGFQASFHDVRKDGLDRSRLQRWFAGREWHEVINTRGTTWRGLPPESRPVTAAGALALALQHPTLIKRPVLEIAGKILIGFTAVEYSEVFDNALSNP